MGCVGEVENRKAVQPECAVINLGIAAHVDHDFVSVELPFGMRKFAGGNGTVINEIVIGARFIHYFAREGERSG